MVSLGSANDGQLLVLDSDQRIGLQKVQQHPWIIKHCQSAVKEEKTLSEGDTGPKSISSSVIDTALP